jgi:hypothetical protein
MSEGFGGIRLLSRNEISEDKWDTICQKSDFPIFNSLWYLDSVCDNWKAFVLKDYELALPIFPSNRWGLNYSLQPLFVRSVSVMGEEKYKVNEFLKYVFQFFHFFELNFDDQVIINYKDLRTEENFFQLLNFKDTYELIRSSYSENARRKLKQFEKWETSIDCSDNIHDLINIFKNEKGGIFQNLNESSYESLKNIMTNALKNQYGNVYSVKFQNEIIAIGFFIYFGNHLLYLKGAVTKIGKEKGAMYGLFDHVIRKFHSSFKRLDFGGSSDEGVAGFNKKFGACDMKYLILKKNNVMWPLNRIIKSKLGI